MSKSARSRRARKQLRLSNGQFATPGQKMVEWVFQVGFVIVLVLVIAKILAA